MEPVPATAADAPDVIALMARIWEEYAFIWDPVTEVPDLFLFEQHYAPPSGAFWVVRDGGRVVGAAGARRVDDRTAELRRVYLDAELRGRGIGRALVEAAIGWARAQGLARVVLWSDTRFDASHRLYRRLGFEQLGERTVAGDVNASREYRFERDV